MPPVVPAGRARVRAEGDRGDHRRARAMSCPCPPCPVDGTWPTGTTQWEKRNIALEIPVWDAVDLHPVRQVRARLPACGHPHQGLPAAKQLADAPATFKSMDYKSRDLPGMKYTVQVAPEDCTGCGLCVEICPAKNKSEPRLKAINMAPQLPLREHRARELRSSSSICPSWTAR